MVPPLRRLELPLRVRLRFVSLPLDRLDLGDLLLELGDLRLARLPLRALGRQLLLVELLRVLELRLERRALLGEERRELRLARSQIDGVGVLANRHRDRLGRCGGRANQFFRCLMQPK